MRRPLTAGRCACPAGYSGLPGAVAPGADKPRLRPFSHITRGGPAALPLWYPHLCLARSYWLHAGTFRGKIIKLFPAPGVGPWDRGGPPLSHEARRVALPQLVCARSAAIAALRKATRRRRTPERTPPL
ncbi:hypothetical protein B5F55_12150 [Anaerotruncus colihominis]|nr:hypothetical protein B5F55_12150 [Anaerotruncus colihominis]